MASCNILVVSEKNIITIFGHLGTEELKYQIPFKT